MGDKTLIVLAFSQRKAKASKLTSISNKCRVSNRKALDRVQPGDEKVTFKHSIHHV